MSTRKWMVASSLMLAAMAVLAAVMALQVAPAWGQPDAPREGQGEPGQRPPQFPPDGPGGFQPGWSGPGGFGRFGMAGGGGPAALAVQGDYVYVVRGNTLFQFQVNGLKLVKKVTLEEEPPFAPMGRPRQQPGESRRQRPPQKDRE